MKKFALFIVALLLFGFTSMAQIKMIVHLNDAGFLVTVYGRIKIL